MPIHGTDEVKALEDLWRARIGGVFIDDTGSPGARDTPQHLHEKRKSWVAVVVPRHQIREVMEQSSQMLQGLEDFEEADADLRNALRKITELHFVDVYQGTNEFKGIPIKVRFAIFEFMAQIFAAYKFQILVQTLDPNKKAAAAFREQFPQGIKPFDFRRHEDTALFLLFIRVKWFLRDQMGNETVRLFLDEGRFKAGSIVRISGLYPPFLKGEIVSATSRDLPPLQLADFAAFVLNRTQWLLGRQNLKAHDRRLLELLSPLAPLFANITTVQARLDDWPPLRSAELEELLNNPGPSPEDKNRDN